MKLIFKFFRSKKKRLVKRFPPAGAHYNLQEIYDSVNAQYFEGKLDLPIRWFGSRDFVPRRRVKLGSYNQKTQLIKIHRLLDKPEVPPYFVTYIVYHEMLHHVLPPIKSFGRRRQIHHKAYNDREKHFLDYTLAKAFSKKLTANWFG